MQQGNGHKRQLRQRPPANGQDSYPSSPSSPTGVQPSPAPRGLRSPVQVHATGSYGVKSPSRLGSQAAHTKSSTAGFSGDRLLTLQREPAAATAQPRPGTPGSRPGTPGSPGPRLSIPGARSFSDIVRSEAEHGNDSALGTGSRASPLSSEGLAALATGKPPGLNLPSSTELTGPAVTNMHRAAMAGSDKTAASASEQPDALASPKQPGAVDQFLASFDGATKPGPLGRASGAKAVDTRIMLEAAASRHNAKSYVLDQLAEALGAVEGRSLRFASPFSSPRRGPPEHGSGMGLPKHRGGTSTPGSYHQPGATEQDWRLPAAHIQSPLQRTQHTSADVRLQAQQESVLAALLGSLADNPPSSGAAASSSTAAGGSIAAEIAEESTDEESAAGDGVATDAAQQRMSKPKSKLQYSEQELLAVREKSNTPTSGPGSTDQVTLPRGLVQQLVTIMCEAVQQSRSNQAHWAGLAIQQSDRLQAMDKALYRLSERLNGIEQIARQAARGNQALAVLMADDDELCEALQQQQR